MKKYFIAAILVIIVLLSFWYFYTNNHKRGQVINTPVSQNPIIRQQATTTPYTEFDNSFVCPEDMQTGQEQLDALTNFVTAYKKINPDATVEDMLSHRYALLVSHNCKVTLQNLENAELNDAKSKAVK